MKHRAEKKKITKAKQIRVNGEQPDSLCKKVQVSAEQGRKAILEYKKKKGLK